MEASVGWEGPCMMATIVAFSALVFLHMATGKEAIRHVSTGRRAFLFSRDWFTCRRLQAAIIPTVLTPSHCSTVIVHSLIIRGRDRPLHHTVRQLVIVVSSATS